MSRHHLTAIGRRLQAGEAVPAWRPVQAGEAVQAWRPVETSHEPPPLPLDVRPISAAEARAAAQEVNAWARDGRGEIEIDTIRLLCQWVLRVTRGAA